MTVSKSRKSTYSSRDDKERYSCDACDADITNFIRIKCAAPGCEEVDLCPRCFCEGREVGSHKAWHDYRVIDQPTYPIYSEDWGADEELLLLDGILASGLGDWQGVSDRLFGLRSKAEVEEHYRSVYLASPAWPRVEKRAFPFYDREAFLVQKRRRIQAMSDAPPPPPPPKPPTSVPASHEIHGYMPGRLEFEHEIVHDAEEAVADLQFGLVMQYGGDEQPEPEPEPEPELEDADMDGEEEETGAEEQEPEPVEPLYREDLEEVQVKLALIKGYHDKLLKRIQTKEIVFQRGLVDFKKMQASEKKRPKDEREAYQRQKPFARVQTAEDFEVFVDGILYEATLKKRIVELQQMRRDGLLSTLEIDRYDKDKAQHASHRAHPERSYSQTKSVRSSLPPGTERGSAPPRGSHEPSALPASATSKARKPPPPLNLANAHSIHLLTPAEQVFCSQMRIFPKPFLAMKESLVREYARRHGKMTRREARDVLKIDVNKVGRIWDFFKDCGLLVPAVEDSPSPAKTLTKSSSKPPSSAPKQPGSVTAKLMSTVTPIAPKILAPAQSSPLPKGPIAVPLASKPLVPSPLKHSSQPSPSPGVSALFSAHPAAMIPSLLPKAPSTPSLSEQPTDLLDRTSSGGLGGVGESGSGAPQFGSPLANGSSGAKPDGGGG